MRSTDALRDRFRYRVCGLTVEATQPIPALTHVESDASAPNVELTLGPNVVFPDTAPPDSGEPFYTSGEISEDGAPRLRVWTADRDNGLVRLRHANGTDCLIDRSNAHLWMTWLDTTRDPHAFLFEHVLGLLLRWQGFTVLHAAAIVIGTRAVALAGPPGVGKSTLTAALAKRGHEVLTDDVASVSLGHQGHVAHPGPRRVRPRSQASSQLRDLLPRETLARYSPDGDSIDLTPDRLDYVPARESATLAFLWFLTPGAAPGEVAAEAVRPADAAIRLIADSWVRRLQDDVMRAQEIDQVSQVVGAIPAWQLTFDAGSAWVHAACLEIEQRASAAEPERQAS